MIIDELAGHLLTTPAVPEVSFALMMSTFGLPQIETSGPNEQIRDFTRLQAHGEAAGCVVGLTWNGGGAGPKPRGSWTGSRER